MPTTELKILQEIASQQSDSISLMAGSIEELANEVQARPTKRHAYTVLVVVSIITLIIVSAMFYKVLESRENVRDTILCNEEKIMEVIDLALDGFEYEPLDKCIVYIEDQIGKP